MLHNMNCLRFGKLVPFFLAFSIVVVPTCARGQNASNAPQPIFLLAHVGSTGSQRFAESDIVKMSGLKAGTRMSAADLQQASGRLAQTGVFSQISYRFDGVTATFLVTDSDQFVPAAFENFVWFTDADLTQRIQAVVPLFSGNLPLSGNLTEAVSNALESILHDRGITGRVVSEASPAIGAVTYIQFRIDGLKVAVTDLKFPGASPSQVVLLQQAEKLILAHPYLQSETLPAIKRQAQAIYGKSGYLAVQFGPTQVSLVKDDPSAPEVAVEMPVQEGPQYTVSGVDWRDNAAISTTDLMKAISCKPGALADTSCLAGAIAAAQLLYGAKGFMAAQVKATAAIDNDAHTAAFHLNVEEGPIYHLGKLELLGLPDEQGLAVRRTWAMHEGDVYDASYGKSFLIKHVAQYPALNGWEAHYIQTIHDDTQTVDLSMKFQKMN